CVACMQYVARTSGSWTTGRKWAGRRFIAPRQSASHRAKGRHHIEEGEVCRRNRIHLCDHRDAPLHLVNDPTVNDRAVNGLPPAANTPPRGPGKNAAATAVTPRTMKQNMSRGAAIRSPFQGWKQNWMAAPRR